MRLRRAIGISFACLVTSACAIAKTPEKSASHYTGEATRTASRNSATLSAKPRRFACGAARNGRQANERAEPRGTSFEPAIDTCDDGSASCCGPTRVNESGQIGQASWYDLVGNKTANGEILDTVTATAAHRSLPLASFAKVTDLDNGRSVVVKINDRGPYVRGRIIDLSPRAADALDIKSIGVADVVIEPLLMQAAPTVAAFQNFDTVAAP